MMMKNRKNIIVFTIVMFCLASMVVIELMNFSFIEDEATRIIVQSTLSRICGGMIFILIIYTLGFTYLKPQKIHWKTLLIIAPPLLVSINNFPFITLIAGTAIVTEPTQTILLFALQCLSVGLFEEMVFRGFILVLLLERMPKTRIGVFQSILISSIIFGGMHALNLFLGASFSGTILQIGYSFLTGMMWAVVFLATKNIWFSVILHAIYNFMGLLFYELGTISEQNDVITIILTTVIALAVTAYCIRLFLKLNLKDVEQLYSIST